MDCTLAPGDCEEPVSCRKSCLGCPKTVSADGRALVAFCMLPLDLANTEPLIWGIKKWKVFGRLKEFLRCPTAISLRCRRKSAH
jgi:hypothetical protein